MTHTPFGALFSAPKTSPRQRVTARILTAGVVSFVVAAAGLAAPSYASPGVAPAVVPAVTGGTAYTRAPAAPLVDPGVAPFTHAQPKSGVLIGEEPSAGRGTGGPAESANQVLIPTTVPAGLGEPTEAAPAGEASRGTGSEAATAAPAGSGAGVYPAPASIPVPNGTANPGFLAFPAGAYDSIRGVVVKFGGGDAMGGPTSNDTTWTWDGRIWTDKAPAHAPSARGAAAMAFDTATGTALLFGGSNGSTVYGDTWKWDGTDWTLLSPAASPPARSMASMAYSPALGKIVLFGGRSATGDLGDTWTWNGTTWTSVTTPAALTPRAQGAMAYDTTGAKLVYYGGQSGTGTTYYGETWQYGSTGWVKATPAHSPGTRAGQGMAYNPVLGRVVLVGGDDPTQTFNDQWLWNGTDWLQGKAPNYVAWRSNSLFVTAPSNGQIFSYGGRNSAGTVFGQGYVLDWGQLGTPKGATFETRNVGSRVNYGVNVNNGNVVVSTTDMAVTGPGLSLTISRLENTQSGYQGWVGTSSELTNGFDTWWGALPDGSIILNGVRGKADMLYFKKTGATFVSPPGSDAILTTSGAGYVLTMNASAEKLSFDGTGHLVSNSDRNGNTITFGWTAGKPASITDTAGRVFTVGLSPDDKIATITDPTSRVITYTQNFYGWLDYFTDGAGKVYDYNFNGTTSLFDLLKDPNGNTTTFAYDANNALATITYPQAAPNTQTYTYAGPLVGASNYLRSTSKDPKNNTTTYDLNYPGLVNKTTDALGHSRSSTYTSNSDVATSTDAMGIGNVSTFGYDALNNPTTSALPTGATASAYYSNGPNCSTTVTTQPYLAKCITDAQGNQNTATYDTRGNLTQNKNTTTGATLTNTRNPAVPTCGGKPGQVCSSADGKGNTTTYTYDSAGNLTTVTPPAPLGATTQTFDAIGRVLTVTDGKGQKTTTSYDGDDRVTRQLSNGAATCTYSAGTCIDFTYDDAGNPTSQKDRTGTTSYAYDARNRQTSKTLPSAAVLSQAYDPAGNVSSYTDAGGTVTYGYNAANQPTSLAEPGGSCTGTVSKCTTFGNDDNGQRITTTYPGNTVMTSTLDNSGRATQIKTINGSTVLTDYRYTYSNAGTDRALVQTRTDTAGLVTTYGYDSRNLLTSATEKNGATITAAWAYCYDLAGNRTNVSTSTAAVRTCTTAPTISASFNAANQLTGQNGSTTGWAYDANGNETAANTGGPRTSGTWTATNQLSSITVAGSATAMTYAGLSNYERVTLGATTFQSGPTGLASQTGPSANFTKDVRGMLISVRSGTTSNYYLYDNQGSVIGLVNNAGVKTASYSYDPYGQTRTTTGTVANPYRYTSGYTDPTGLIKLGYRYYDPTTGRFTQPDPSGQETNTYLYAGGNPANYTDPSGLWYIAFAVIGCLSASVGIDSTNGWQAGFGGGFGTRAELSAGVVGGVGQMGGDQTQTSVECGLKGGPGGTVGIGASSPDFYGGPSFGAGGGCSLMFTNYIGLG